MQNQIAERFIEKIRNKIGDEVVYKFPEGEQRGVLVDRIVVCPKETVNFSEARRSGIIYFDVVDYILFPKAKEREWVRFSYYRVVPRGNEQYNFIYAGQTTITEPISVWKQIFLALRKKEWSKKFLKEVGFKL